MKSIYLSNLVDPEKPVEYHGYSIIASSETGIAFSFEDRDYLCLYKKNKNKEYIIYIYEGEFDEYTNEFFIESTLYRSFPMMYYDPHGIHRAHADLVAGIFNLDIKNINLLSRILLGYFPAYGIVNSPDLENVTIN